MNEMTNTTTEATKLVTLERVTAEARIMAWIERLRLNRLKDCQEKGDTGYETLPYGGDPDAR